MLLAVWDPQLVPSLTPCSPASFMLKNIRLPMMQRRVGLPRVTITFVKKNELELYLLSSILRMEHRIALRLVQLEAREIGNEVQLTLHNKALGL